MAKRKRTFSLDSLVAELSDLDARRKTVVNQLNAAIRSFAGGGGALVASFSPTRRRGRPAGTKTVKRNAGRKRKMSAAARKKISQAQKKRWAQQRSGKK
jgi:hypothetical protein